MIANSLRSNSFSFVWIALSFPIVATIALAQPDAQPPRLADDRLQLTLFAEDPQIVTPIGMAIDDSDRVFVIESHTHSPPDGYDGPDGDRIKIFVDADNDGRADLITVFAEGIQQAMNLAFAPDGELYVVCAREVLHLADDDHDGVCDRKERVLELVTNQRYAHNSWLSIDFDRDGWMYVGRGNTGSDAYRIQGHDDSAVEGFGDGGNVIRCRPDGTQISELATGFWNPFDLTFDHAGRLLLVDNDPDARGPNRLLQVVPGGDYGYKSMFGGSGTHPFQGWDGTLPGTLPYLCGTGEAPSGLIDCRRSALPNEYGQSVLATIWNENSIERYELDPETASLVKKSIFLSGDQNFRPVALDCDSHGSLFLTDWVLVDYPNHGRGRIWRVSTRQGVDCLEPQDAFAPYQRTERQNEIEAIGMLDGLTVVQRLADGYFSDPMARHAAVMRLASDSTASDSTASDSTASDSTASDSTASDSMADARKACLRGDASLRMVGLLASKRSSGNHRSLIIQLLSDPDPQIRRAALMWAGESADAMLAGELADALAVDPVTPEIFETYLAAAEVLTPEFIRAYRNRSPSNAKKLPRKLDPKLIVDVARNDGLPSSVRSLAIKRLDPDTSRDQMELLDSFLNGTVDGLRIAAIESLTQSGLANERAEELSRIAESSDLSAAVRTQSIAAIETIEGFDSGRLQRLAGDASDQVSQQARRTIKTLVRSPEPSTGRPTTNDQWRRLLASGGDALLGRHVFYSSRVGCSKCHNMNGRGGTLGPGLGGVVRSKTRRQIIDAILEPSAEFAPQYQAWMVLTDDGTIHRGLQLDHKAKGAISLTLESGGDRYFTADEIEAYRALPTSLMPDGLSDLMSVDEFRDLVAYLVSLE